MKFNVDYIGLKWYKREDGSYVAGLRYWFFYFKKYSYVWGFHLRLFGVHFNIREKNATSKLINVLRQSSK